MLNYNYNWIEPLQKQRQFLLGKADWQWSLSTYVASGLFRSPLLVFGTGSIQYVPFAPSTLFASSSYETGSLYSGSAAGLPVDIAITSSGVWPLTGSNTLSIVIGSNVGFNQSEILTLSQAAGNMNLSGSKISSSFYPTINQQYNISFGIQHTKGNIYNPLVNWSAVKTSPLGNTISVNGEVSASFNIVKNTTASDSEEFTNIAFIEEVSGSAQSSSFNNDYSYSVTASYTASINSVTGSTTMSFVCAEEGLDKKVYFFNPNTTTAIGSASFVASNDTSHSLVTSIYYNKGNVNNGPINWSTKNTSPVSNVVTLNGYTASFNLVKDENVSIINYPQITGSRFGTFNNEYAFNFTSSLTASIQADATGSVTMSLEIPEAGIITSSKIFSATSAGVNIITASFDTRNEEPYNITASVIFNKGNISNTPINWLAGSTSTVTQDLVGNTTNLNGVSSSFQIVKDVNVQMVSVANATGSNSGSYQNNYAFNQTASIVSNVNNTTGSVTMSISIPEAGIYTSSIFFNPTTTQAYISASFVSQTNVSSYNITASIINNKGNLSNSNINWRVSSSGPDLTNSSSFNMRKDINVVMASTSSFALYSSSYKNDYAFSQTASISSSFIPFYSVDSSSYYYGRYDLQIPEINFSEHIFVSSSWSNTPTLTASFAAQTNTGSYNVSASAIEYRMPVIDYIVVAGGGAAAGIGSQGQSYYIGGGGAGGVLSGSIALTSSISYTVNVGGGGTNISGSESPYWSGRQSSFYESIAIGGGGGGYNNGTGTSVSPANGGSGGGGKPSGGTGIPGQGTNGQGIANWNGGGANATWLNGTLYGVGGEGMALAGMPVANNGNGANANFRVSLQPWDGNPGVVVIRYQANSQLGTGGTVQQSGSYWYHTFINPTSSFSITGELI